MMNSRMIYIASFFTGLALTITLGLHLKSGSKKIARDSNVSEEVVSDASTFGGEVARPAAVYQRVGTAPSMAPSSRGNRMPASIPQPTYIGSAQEKSTDSYESPSVSYEVSEGIAQDAPTPIHDYYDSGIPAHSYGPAAYTAEYAQRYGSLDYAPEDPNLMAEGSGYTPGHDLEAVPSTDVQ